MTNYILISAIIAIVISALVTYSICVPHVPVVSGYFEIDPSFAAAADLDNMSLYVDGDSGSITTIENDEVIEIPVTVNGNVFYSDEDHPLTNKQLDIYLDCDGVLTIKHEGIILAVMVKDNMVSRQLKK